MSPKKAKNLTPKEYDTKFRGHVTSALHEMNNAIGRDTIKSQDAPPMNMSYFRQDVRRLMATFPKGSFKGAKVDSTKSFCRQVNEITEAYFDKLDDNEWKKGFLEIIDDHRAKIVKLSKRQTVNGNENKENEIVELKVKMIGEMEAFIDEVTNACSDLKLPEKFISHVTSLKETIQMYVEISSEETNTIDTLDSTFQSFNNDILGIVDNLTSQSFDDDSIDSSIMYEFINTYYGIFNERLASDPTSRARFNISINHWLAKKYDSKSIDLQTAMINVDEDKQQYVFPVIRFTTDTLAAKMIELISEIKKGDNDFALKFSDEMQSVKKGELPVTENEITSIITDKLLKKITAFLRRKKTKPDTVEKDLFKYIHEKKYIQVTIMELFQLIFGMNTNDAIEAAEYAYKNLFNKEVCISYENYLRSGHKDSEKLFSYQDVFKSASKIIATLNISEETDKPNDVGGADLQPRGKGEEDAGDDQSDGVPTRAESPLPEAKSSSNAIVIGSQVVEEKMQQQNKRGGDFQRVIDAEERERLNDDMRSYTTNIKNYGRVVGEERINELVRYTTESLKLVFLNILNQIDINDESFMARTWGNMFKGTRDISVSSLERVFTRNMMGKISNFCRSRQAAENIENFEKVFLEKYVREQLEYTITMMISALFYIKGNRVKEEILPQLKKEMDWEEITKPFTKYPDNLDVTPFGIPVTYGSLQDLSNNIFEYMEGKLVPIYNTKPAENNNDIPVTNNPEETQGAINTVMEDAGAMSVFEVYVDQFMTEHTETSHSDDMIANFLQANASEISDVLELDGEVVISEAMICAFRKVLDHKLGVALRMDNNEDDKGEFENYLELFTEEEKADLLMIMDFLEKSLVVNPLDRKHVKTFGKVIQSIASSMYTKEKIIYLAASKVKIANKILKPIAEEATFGKSNTSISYTKVDFKAVEGQLICLFESDTPTASMGPALSEINDRLKSAEKQALEYQQQMNGIIQAISAFGEKAKTLRNSLEEIERKEKALEETVKEMSLLVTNPPDVTSSEFNEWFKNIGALQEEKVANEKELEEFGSKKIRAQEELRDNNTQLDSAKREKESLERKLLESSETVEKIRSGIKQLLDSISN